MLPFPVNEPRNRGRGSNKTTIQDNNNITALRHNSVFFLSSDTARWLYWCLTIQLVVESFTFQSPPFRTCSSPILGVRKLRAQQEASYFRRKAAWSKVRVGKSRCILTHSRQSSPTSVKGLGRSGYPVIGVDFSRFGR